MGWDQYDRVFGDSDKDCEEKDTISIPNVKCLRATSKAILVEIDSQEYWIPQSQISDDSEVWQQGDEGTLVITEWIAEQKGLV